MYLSGSNIQGIESKKKDTLFFTSNARLKLAKNLKQHPEAELLLFENYRFLHPCYHLKMTGDILKNQQKISVFSKRLYVMRCAIWYQSLFGVCMIVRAHVNAC